MWWHVRQSRSLIGAHLVDAEDKERLQKLRLASRVAQKHRSRADQYERHEHGEDYTHR